MFPSDASAKQQWNEPWLFKLRSSTRTAWLARIAFFVAVYVLFVVLLSAEKKSPNSPKFGTVQIVVLPAMVAGLFLVMFELPNVQRTITLTDNDISCIGTFMVFGGPIHLITGMRQWNRRGIKEIRLLRPGEPENRFSHGLMVVSPKYARARQLAIPSSVSLEGIANHVHSMGIAVGLSGWQPEQSASTGTDSRR